MLIYIWFLNILEIDVTLLFVRLRVTTLRNIWIQIREILENIGEF